MNNNFKILLLGTSLSLIPQYAMAQCAVTDCQQLGYTSLKSCNGGLKCPFGEYWACPCDASYKYTCTGANESKGADSCGGKYKSCNCASGYEWKDGKCQTKGAVLGQCTGYAKNCSIGQILNSDGTCSNDKVSGKTPIGVVVYISGGADKCGYAMTASPIQAGIQWGGYGTDIPELPNYTSWQTAIADFDVSGNMTKIIQAANGISYKYPAANAAMNYAPSSAPTSKGKWTLPTAGILNSLYTNLNAINNAISKVGGIQLTGDNERIWSSSEANDDLAWVLCTDGNANYGSSWFICPDDGANCGGVLDYPKTSSASDNVVRPVLAF